MNELQQAIINSGLTELEFTSGDRKETVRVEELPSATLIRLLTYGKRAFNDYVNSAANAAEPAEGQSQDEAKEAARTEAADTWLQRARDGKLGEAQGGGRTRLTPLEKEIRAIVEEYLRQGGMKAGDAKKASKQPRDAFAGYLGHKLAVAKGEGNVTEEMAAEAFDRNWPKVEDQARKRLALAESVDIDI